MGWCVRVGARVRVGVGVRAGARVRVGVGSTGGVLPQSQSQRRWWYMWCSRMQGQWWRAVVCGPGMWSKLPPAWPPATRNHSRTQASRMSGAPVPRPARTRTRVVQDHVEWLPVEQPGGAVAHAAEVAQVERHCVNLGAGHGGLQPRLRVGRARGVAARHGDFVIALGQL
eukprot:365948-Chlamydomonas_euryale.AAC.12